MESSDLPWTRWNSVTVQARPAPSAGTSTPESVVHVVVTYLVAAKHPDSELISPKVNKVEIDEFSPFTSATTSKVVSDSTEVHALAQIVNALPEVSVPKEIFGCGAGDGPRIAFHRLPMAKLIFSSGRDRWTLREVISSCIGDHVGFGNFPEILGDPNGVLWSKIQQTQALIPAGESTAAP